MKIALVLLSAVVAGPAIAYASDYNATLAQSVASQADVAADGNIWHCASTRCVLITIPKDAGSLGACRALAHKVGQLTEYVAKGKAFDSDKLAKCNG